MTISWRLSIAPVAVLLLGLTVSADDPTKDTTSHRITDAPPEMPAIKKSTIAPQYPVPKQPDRRTETSGAPPVASGKPQDIEVAGYFSDAKHEDVEVHFGSESSNRCFGDETSNRTLLDSQPESNMDPVGKQAAWEIASDDEGLNETAVSHTELVAANDVSENPASLVSYSGLVNRIRDLEVRLDKQASTAVYEGAGSFNLGGCDAGCGCCGPPPCSSFFAYGEWLYLKPRSQSLDVATQATMANVPLTTERLHYPFDAGFRVGGGYRFGHGWDFTGNYQYLESREAERFVPHPGNNLLLNRGPAAGMSFPFVDGDARIHIQSVEFVTGRTFPFACFDGHWRVFSGLHWSKIDQDLYIQYGTGQANLWNQMKMEGIGLKFGAVGSASLGKQLSVFVRGAGSILHGDFQTIYRRQNGAGQATQDVQDSYRKGVPVAELKTGISWCNGCFDFSAGYELTTWFGADERHEIDHAVPTIPGGIHDYNLTMDGFFLRATVIR